MTIWEKEERTVLRAVGLGSDPKDPGRRQRGSKLRESLTQGALPGKSPSRLGPPRKLPPVRGWGSRPRPNPPKDHPEGRRSREGARAGWRRGRKRPEERVEFSLQERPPRDGAGEDRARRSGVGKPGATLPGPQATPRVSRSRPPAPAPSGVGLGTHGGRRAGGCGWAASALQSGAPLRGVSAGGPGA